MFPLRLLLRITLCGLVIANINSNQFQTESSIIHLTEELSQSRTADTASVESRTNEHYTADSITVEQTTSPWIALMENSSRSFQNTANLAKRNEIRIGYTNYVHLVVLPSCFVVGCIGNILTIVTMAALPFRKMTWSIVLICLAIADTNVLCGLAIDNSYLRDWIGIDIRSMSNVGCKTFYFFRRVGKMVSSWLVVLICAERFVAICFPLKVKYIWTKRKVILSIVVICFIAAGFCANSVSNVGLLKSICSRSLVTSETRLRVWVTLLVGSMMSAILPMLILIILTPIICVILIRQMRARTQITSLTDRADPYKRASAMLVGVHTSYIILALPHFMNINFKFVSQFNPTFYNKEAMSIFGQIAAALEIINYSINFYLYVGLNSMFRKRLKNLFSRTSSTNVQEFS